MLGFTFSDRIDTIFSNNPSNEITTMAQARQVIPQSSAAEVKALAYVPDIINQILEVDAQYASLANSARLEKYSALLSRIGKIICALKEATDESIMLDFLREIVNEYRINTTRFIPFAEACSHHLASRAKGLRENNRLPHSELLALFFKYPIYAERNKASKERLAAINNLRQRERLLERTLVLRHPDYKAVGGINNFPWYSWRRVLAIVTVTQGYKKIIDEEKNAAIANQVKQANQALEQITKEMQREAKLINVGQLSRLILDATTGFDASIAAIPDDSPVYQMFVNAISKCKKEQLEGLGAISKAIDSEIKVLDFLRKYISEGSLRLAKKVPSDDKKNHEKEEDDESFEVDERWYKDLENINRQFYNYLLGHVPARYTSMPYEDLAEILQQARDDINGNPAFATAKSELLPTVERMLQLMLRMRKSRDIIDNLNRSLYIPREYKLDSRKEEAQINALTKELASDEASFLKMAKGLARNEAYFQYIKTKYSAAAKSVAAARKI